MAQWGGSGSESLLRLQASCWPEPWSSEGLVGPLSGSLVWLLAGGFSSLPCGPLTAQRLASQSEEPKSKRTPPTWNPQCQFVWHFLLLATEGLDFQDSWCPWAFINAASLPSSCDGP